MTKLLEEMMQTARGLLAADYGANEADHEVSAMYFLYRGTALYTVVVLADVPQHSQEKSALARQVAEVAKEHGCDGFVHLSEAWTIPQGAEALVPMGEYFQDQPNRIEIMSLFAGVLGGGRSAQIAYLNRSAGPHAQLDWQPAMFGTSAEMQGRFDLFTPQDVQRRSTEGRFHPTTQ